MNDPHRTVLALLAGEQEQGSAVSEEAEEWRAVVGDEGAYEVSSLGQVRSLERTITDSTGAKRRIRGGLMRGSSTGKRYLYVMLSGQRFVAIHVLVCRAFHGPKPSPTHMVAHFNGVHTDNRASNLRWATASENTLDKRRHGTLSQSGPRKLDWEKVDEIRAVWDQGSATITELSRRYGVHYMTMWKVVHGRTWVRPAPAEAIALLDR